MFQSATANSSSRMRRSTCTFVHCSCIGVSAWTHRSVPPLPHPLDKSPCPASVCMRVVTNNSSRRRKDGSRSQKPSARQRPRHPSMPHIAAPTREFSQQLLLEIDEASLGGEDDPSLSDIDDASLAFIMEGKDDDETEDLQDPTGRTKNENGSADSDFVFQFQDEEIRKDFVAMSRREGVEVETKLYSGDKVDFDEEIELMDDIDLDNSNDGHELISQLGDELDNYLNYGTDIEDEGDAEDDEDDAEDDDEVDSEFEVVYDLDSDFDGDDEEDEEEDYDYDSDNVIVEENVTDINVNPVYDEGSSGPNSSHLKSGQTNTLADTKASARHSEPFFGSGTFSSLGITSELCEALKEAGIEIPTKVQQRGIPAVLGGANVVLGAATGSGKTYAYLLPVITMLKAAEELRNVGEPPLRVARRPRSLVVVPTRELAEQVLAVAKTLSYKVKFRTIGTTTGTGPSGLRKLKHLLASSPADVLVSTTGRLLQLMEDKSVDLRFAKHIVIDEVDTMFDEGFGPELKRILRACRGRDQSENIPQFIAVGATHPKAAEDLYEGEFPGAKRIKVDLHLAPPGLQARFIRTTHDQKLHELTALLGESKKNGHLRGGRLIIFCNTISSARFVEHFLSEAGYTTASVHGNIPPDRRHEEFQSFKTGKVQLLVCTDIAARGLDNLDIAHVVIFDFPASAVDYIHRAGRTARAGAKGQVTSFVLKRDLPLARAVERAAKGKNDALVSAQIAQEEERQRRLREEADRQALDRAAVDDADDGDRLRDTRATSFKGGRTSHSHIASKNRRGDQQRGSRNPATSVGNNGYQGARRPPSESRRTKREDSSSGDQPDWRSKRGRSSYGTRSRSNSRGNQYRGGDSSRNSFGRRGGANSGETRNAGGKNAASRSDRNRRG